MLGLSEAQEGLPQPFCAFRGALALVASGKINLQPLISKSFPLEEAQKAFEHFASGEPIKVLIQANAPEDCAV